MTSAFHLFYLKFRSSWKSGRNGQFTRHYSTTTGRDNQRQIRGLHLWWTVCVNKIHFWSFKQIKEDDKQLNLETNWEKETKNVKMTGLFLYLFLKLDITYTERLGIQWWDHLDQWIASIANANPAKLNANVWNVPVDRLSTAKGPSKWPDDVVPSVRLRETFKVF